MNPSAFGPDGEPIPPLPASPEEENATANRVGEVVGGTVDGAGLIADVVEGVSSAASGAVEAIGGVVTGVGEAIGGVAGGAAEAVGGVAEGAGSAVGAAAEGCGSCSLALLVMLVSVGAAVAAVLR